MQFTGDLSFNGYNQPVLQAQRSYSVSDPSALGTSGQWRSVPSDYQVPTATRKAGAAPGDWLDAISAFLGGRKDQAAAGLRGITSWGPRKLAVGAGGLGLGAVLAAASELNNSDPTVTTEQKLGGAAGAGLGSLGLGAGGALLGGMLAGPIGAAAAGIALSTLGGAAGGGVGRGLMGILGPSEADKQLDLQRRQAQQQIALEVERQKALLPVQQKAAEWGMANRAREQALMNPLIAQAQFNQAAAQNLVQAQAASNAQSQLMTQLLMGSIV